MQDRNKNVPNLHNSMAHVYHERSNLLTGEQKALLFYWALFLDHTKACLKVYDPGMASSVARSKFRTICSKVGLENRSSLMRERPDIRQRILDCLLPSMNLMHNLPLPAPSTVGNPHLYLNQASAISWKLALREANLPDTIPNLELRPQIKGVVDWGMLQHPDCVGCISHSKLRYDARTEDLPFITISEFSTVLHVKKGGIANQLLEELKPDDDMHKLVAELDFHCTFDNPVEFTNYIANILDPTDPTLPEAIRKKTVPHGPFLRLENVVQSASSTDRGVVLALLPSGRMVASATPIKNKFISERTAALSTGALDLIYTNTPAAATYWHRAIKMFRDLVEIHTGATHKY